MTPDNDTREHYGTPWKKIATNWAKLGDGNHPSPYDLSVYEMFLDRVIVEVARPRVVVFGATPELRDMLERRPTIEVTVLDLHREMIEAMAPFMLEDSSREIWVQGNWLEAPLPDHSYDAVFGDQIRINIPFAKQEDLYRRVRELLIPNGAFITRDTTSFPEPPIYNVEELIQRFSAIVPTKKSLTEFMNKLLFFTHRNFESTTDRMYTLLEAHLEASNIRNYYEQILEILPRGQSWDAGRSWEEVSRTLFKYFSLEDKRRDDTVFADTTFIYCLRPRVEIGL